jgi:transcriptional regulator with XRE-family HTH domain
MEITKTTPPTIVLTEMGRRIALARKSQGMNQRDLARASGLGIATIARIETGWDSQFSSWVKIFSALGMHDALNRILAENLSSPMAEVKRKRRGASAQPGAFRWGDEAQ